MSFHTPSPASHRRSVARHHAEREARTDDLTERLRAAYEQEPDRAYADEMWGSLLRERGAL